MRLPATIYFFGAVDRPGHYLFGPGLGPAHWDRFETLDGTLAPKDHTEAEWRAKMWRLHGFDSIPWSALSWWDRSCDRRMGSNSTIFAPGETVGAEGMLSEAKRLFPRLVPRLDRVQPLPDVEIRTRSEP